MSLLRLLIIQVHLRLPPRVMCRHRAKYDITTATATTTAAILSFHNLAGVMTDGQ